MTLEIILAFINYFGSGRLASRKQTNKQLKKPKQNKMEKKKPNQKKKYQLGVNIPVMYLRLMH